MNIGSEVFPPSFEDHVVRINTMTIVEISKLPWSNYQSFDHDFGKV